jgi:MFS transporter, FSR family, fosmidomycin resistance protein
MNRNNNSLPLAWGILHGINDWIAGFMLAGFTFRYGPSESFMPLVIYAILAFGGQLPVGFALDSTRNIKGFGQISLLLLLIAGPVYLIHPMSGIVLAGFASAGIHVVGGTVCLMLHNDKSGPLGLFTAPGVVGLALGTLSGSMTEIWLLLPMTIVLVLGGIILRLGFPVYTVASGNNNKPSELDSHDWIMLSLLLVMCFRSFIYDVINHFSQQYEQGILIIGISAFAGKIIGGFMADKIGWKKWVYTTLPLALILLHFGRENLYMLGFGIACLQSSVPITLMLMRKAVPAWPATGVALNIGASVAIAGLPLYIAAIQNRVEAWTGTAWWWIASLVLFMIAWRVIGQSLGRKKLKGV